MTDQKSEDREADAAATKPAETQGLDPRDTDHPAGEEQAAENVVNDSPS